MKNNCKLGKNHRNFAEAGRFSFLACGRIIKNSVSAPLVQFYILMKVLNEYWKFNLGTLTKTHSVSKEHRTLLPWGSGEKQLKFKEVLNENPPYRSDLVSLILWLTWISCLSSTGIHTFWRTNALEQTIDDLIDSTKSGFSPSTF